MTKIRKTHSAQFKYQVASAALRDDKTLAALSQEFGVHVSQIIKWKNLLKDSGPSLFDEKQYKNQRDYEQKLSQLHEKIGELTVERDFLSRTLSR